MSGIVTRLMMVSLALLLALGEASAADTFTWNVNGSGNWDDAANWDNDAAGVGYPVAGDTAIIDGIGSGNTITIPGGGAACAAVQITTVNAFTLSGGTLTLSGDLTDSAAPGGAVTRTIACPVTLGAASAWDIQNTNTTIDLTGVLAASANTYSLTKSGSGILILGNSGNTWGGSTTNGVGLVINAGTVKISAIGCLGNSNNDVTFGGGTLQVTGDCTAAAGNGFDVATSNGTISVDNAVTLTLGQSGNLRAGTTGTLIKAGTGTIVVNNANAAFDGVLRVDAGSLRISGSTSALGDTTNRATLLLNGGALRIYEDTARDFSCALDVAANASITMQRASDGVGLTHSLASTTLAAVTLDIATDASITSGTARINLNATTISGNVTLRTDRVGVGALAIGLNGAVSLGANTLTVDDISSAGNGVGYVDAGGAITASGATIVKQGLGTLVLYGNSTTFDSSLVRVDAGKLRLHTNTTAIGDGTNQSTVRLNGGHIEIWDATGRAFACALDVAVDGAVYLNRNGVGAGAIHSFATTTLGGFRLDVIPGADVTSGTAQLTLNAVTVTGAATVRTDRATAAAVIASLATTSLGANVLTIDDAAGTGGIGNATITGIVSGTSGQGRIVKAGGGTLTLSGANTFDAGIIVKAGTLAGTSDTAAFGTGTITLGDSSGSEGVALRGDGRIFGNAISVASGNTGVVLINPSNSTCGFSGAITLDSHDLLIISAFTLNLTGGITGNGNITIQAIAGNVITFGSNPVNITGTITNSGPGSATNVISGGVGSNVTAIIQDSTTSALTVQTTALTVNGTATTLTNSAGTKALTVSGGVTGTGNLILDNDSATNGGITLITTAINHTGLVTNSGSGTGTVTVTGVIGTAVTGVVQDSATSTLVLSAINTFTSGCLIKAGTLSGTNQTTAFGATTSPITIGHSSGSANATLMGDNRSFAHPITVASGNTGVATITASVGTCTFSGGVALTSHDLVVCTKQSASYRVWSGLA